MAKEVLDILSRIGLERNIPVDTLFDALEAALISASKKMLPPDVEVVEAELDRDTGEFRIYANMEVVEEVEDEHTQISLEEAQEYVEDVQPGEELVIDVTPENFGRIAAQSAKQVITQRIREAEREVIYDKYKNRIGDLVVGTVQRYEKGNVIVDLGNAEAVLSNKEQPMGERYRYGDRIKAIIADIRKSAKDAQIVLSRNIPELVVKLFEQEVAEIRDGIVTIRLVAREPGKRSKIAVLSSDNDVDPVGACVGMKGSRVQMVVQELRGERIDIIEYSDDKKRFVANSLKPANIESVELNEATNRALLVVRDDELALAIGKNGLNARLASELTGVEIDIVSESQLEAREKEAKSALLSISALDEEILDALIVRGIFTYDDILKVGGDGLTRIEGINNQRAQAIIEETQQLVGRHETPHTERASKSGKVSSSKHSNAESSDTIISQEENSSEKEENDGSLEGNPESMDDSNHSNEGNVISDPLSNESESTASVDDDEAQSVEEVNESTVVS